MTKKEKTGLDSVANVIGGSMQTQCRRCVLDKSASEIFFDKNGVCNFCHQAQKSLKEIKKERSNFVKVIRQIRNDGKGKKYDCIIGLSGGVDSSFTLHNAIKLGLRPLAFSVDNGWQSEVAQENVMRLVEGLKIPFYRYVIDLKKFSELQGAFMKAGQINIEIPTDHVLGAVSFEMANKYGIKWILSGGNVATESIMPKSWGYQPRDLKHIKGVYKWATGKNLRGLPTCSLLKFNYYKHIKRIKTLYLLDFLDYNRQGAIELLEQKYGYKSYGLKHEENVFTSWFQNFYLFEKFGIDKRKAHFSSLINSGQMTRDESLQELQKNPIYPRLGIEEKVMEYPIRPYTDFPTNEKLFNTISWIIKKLR